MQEVYQRVFFGGEGKKLRLGSEEGLNGDVVLAMVLV